MVDKSITPLRTHFTPFFSLNGNLALSYAHFKRRQETISRSPQGKIAIQPFF
jgi:hypothetical protein